MMPTAALRIEVEMVSSMSTQNSEKRLPWLGHDVFDGEQFGCALIDTPNQRKTWPPRKERVEEEEAEEDDDDEEDD